MMERNYEMPKLSSGAIGAKRRIEEQGTGQACQNPGELEEGRVEDSEAR